MTTIKASTIAKSGLWLTLSFVIARLLQVVTQMILARFLAPQDFGLWSLVVIVTTLSNLFKDHSVAAVLVQRGLEDPRRVNAVYSVGMHLTIAIGILQGLLSYPLAYFLGVPQLTLLLLCVSLSCLFSGGTGIRETILQRQLQFQNVALCEMSMAVARLLGSVGCVVLGGGVWAFVSGELCMAIVGSIISRQLCTYPLRYSVIPDWQAIREVQGYIASILGINLAVYLNTNADNFLIGKLLNTTALGFYSVAYQLAMLPMFALSQIQKVTASVLPQSQSNHHQNHIYQLIEFYALLYAPLYGGLYLSASWLIPMLYGAAWEPAIEIFQITLLFAYTRGFMSILGTFLNAIDKPGINAMMNGLLVPISITAFYWGAKWNGILGVTIAAAVVMGIIATLWFVWVTCWVTRWPISAVIQPSLAPTIASVIAILFIRSLPILLVPKLMLFLALYSLGVSLLSHGRIPQKIYQLIYKLYRSRA